MDEKQAAALRTPFPPEVIGKLPKLNCKACGEKARNRDLAASDRHCGRHTVKECPVCGNFITTGHIHLDYVGHAATTSRLLEVDPVWTWRPLATEVETGFPKFDSQGGLWILLTVAGVTRPGYGDGKTPKEVIGDAIRNAAMRFGVALDLWAKEDLHASEDPRPVAPAADQEPAGDEQQKYREEVSGKYNPSPEEVEAGEARRAHEQRSTLDVSDPDRANISALQVRRLFAIARGEYELSDATIKATIEAVTGQTSSRQIKRYQYDPVMDELARVALAVPK